MGRDYKRLILYFRRSSFIFEDDYCYCNWKFSTGRILLCLFLVEIKYVLDILFHSVVCIFPLKISKYICDNSKNNWLRKETDKSVHV